jgi:hypothetical protein
VGWCARRRRGAAHLALARAERGEGVGRRAVARRRVDEPAGPLGLVAATELVEPLGDRREAVGPTFCDGPGSVDHQLGDLVGTGDAGRAIETSIGVAVPGERRCLGPRRCVPRQPQVLVPPGPCGDLLGVDGRPGERGVGLVAMEQQQVVEHGGPDERRVVKRRWVAQDVPGDRDPLVTPRLIVAHAADHGDGVRSRRRHCWSMTRWVSPCSWIRRSRSVERSSAPSGVGRGRGRWADLRLCMRRTKRSGRPQRCGAHRCDVERLDRVPRRSLRATTSVGEGGQSGCELQLAARASDDAGARGGDREPKARRILFPMTVWADG